MTIDEQIAALTAHLDKINLQAEVTSVNMESLHASCAELHASAQSHDAQIAALIVESRERAATSKQDAESIRALARIAEIPERRLSSLEGSESGL